MSATASSTAARATRPRLWGRRLMYTVGALGLGVGVTEVATDHSVSRSLRAISAFFRVIAMYKFQTPETAEEYFAMHQRAADSILNVCLTNEGLYVKLGQGLNAMSHMLPKEYTNTLKVLLDNAKPVAMHEVRQTIEEETGRKLEDIFVRFDEVPVASASIAQVHKAWLPHPLQRTEMGGTTLGGAAGGANEDGAYAPIPVAVKVRKPCIGRQSKWDIYTFQFFSFTIQHLFGLPTAWSRKTIVDGLKREMDFTIEAANAEQIRQNFKDDPRIHIPTMYPELSSKRLLVMEWVDAAKLSETEKICANFNEKAVLRTLFDAFGDMVFKHGFVHCDPHAANVLVRHVPEAGTTAAPFQSSETTGSLSSPETAGSNTSRNRGLSQTRGDTTRNDNDGGAPFHQIATTPPVPSPTRKSKNDFQIVLLDFGLCVPESERFRMLYALLFKSLVTRDMDSLKKVVQDWGISDPEIFASMQMQKPLKSIRDGSYGEVTRDEVRQMQRDAHARIKSFMIDEAKIPRELPMVGRSIDILRSINRLYGSPINRVNMFVQSAVNALGPLYDYDGVQRYLARVRRLVEETQAKEGSRTNHGEGEASSHTSVMGVLAKLRGTQSSRTGYTRGAKTGTEAEFESVYDDGALKLRREQAAASREILAERSSSVTARMHNSLTSLYRAFLFHLVMFNFSMMHHVTRLYNELLRLVFPPAQREKLKAASFEDRLEKMEESMRVE